VAGRDTAPLTESCIGLNRLRRLSALGYGRCMVGRHCWRAGRGSYGDVADRRRSV